MGDCASYFWWRLLETAGWVYHDGLRPTIFSGNSRGYFSKCPNCWCIGNFNRKMMINQKFQDDFFTSENEDFSATILWGFMNVSSTIWFVQQNWGFTSCQMHKSRKNQQISGVSVPEIGVKCSGFQTPWVMSCTKSREPPLGKSKEHIPDNFTGSYRFQDHRIFDLGLCRWSLWTWIKMWSKFQAWLHSHPRWHRSPMRPKKWRKIIFSKTFTDQTFTMNHYNGQVILTNKARFCLSLFTQDQPGSGCEGPSVLSKFKKREELVSLLSLSILCICMCIYICIYIYRYIHTYTYIYIHSHIHISTST